MIVPGDSIKTDDWAGYCTLPSLGYLHVITKPKDLVLPHLVASLFKRWLMRTYQGAVRPSHLGYYLDEFTFRFNRRTSKSRGKLFYRLVQHVLSVDPVFNKELNALIPSEEDENFDDLEDWDDHNM